jgi:threonylcarbamoyladenosine tRNA methylthiotransferase MtaB
MGRPYTAGEAAEAAEKLRALKDDPFLACDIIAGFPGESGEDFERTLELCGRIGFAWIHAFPYSPRPETAAFQFKDPVGQGEVSARVETLNSLAKRGRAAYISRWLGRTVEAVPEHFADPGPAGSVPAVSENYLKVLLSPLPGGTFTPNGGLSIGRAVRCRISALARGESGGRFDVSGSVNTGNANTLQERGLAAY